MAGWSHRFAAILAAHGVMALPWSYGEGTFWRAGPIANVDLGGLIAAGDTLAAHDRVGSVGLFGWSRGGEVAMHIAAGATPGGPFDAIAAHAPADTCLNAFDPARYLTGASAVEADPEGPRQWIWAGHEAGLVPGQKIEVERWAAPMFLSVGDADDIWDHTMTLRLAERRAGLAQETDLFVAEGQGHGFDFDAEPQLWSRLLAFFDRHLGGRA